jgi:hypothetical protein
MVSFKNIPFQLKSGDRVGTGSTTDYFSRAVSVPISVPISNTILKGGAYVKVEKDQTSWGKVQGT